MPLDIASRPTGASHDPFLLADVPVDLQILVAVPKSTNSWQSKKRNYKQLREPEPQRQDDLENQDLETYLVLRRLAIVRTLPVEDIGTLVPIY